MTIQQSSPFFSVFESKINVSIYKHLEKTATFQMGLSLVTEKS
jgi:hypothetical protein